MAGVHRNNARQSGRGRRPMAPHRGHAALAPVTGQCPRVTAPDRGIGASRAGVGAS